MSTPTGPQITLVDLARRLNLSPGAVSHALNGPAASTIRVSPETAKRVRTMAAKLGYRPNRVARMLRTGRSGMAGILAYQGFSPLQPQLLYHARQNAERIGLIPFVYEITNSTKESANLAVDFMLDAKVDVLLVLGSNLDLQSRLANAGIPIAFIGKLESRTVPSYFIDQRGGYGMVTRHLLDQGYSKLALVTDEEGNYRSASIQGVESVIKACQRNGRKISLDVYSPKVTFDGIMAKGVPHMHGLYAHGYLGMKEILASGNLPEAIIFQADNFAQGGIRACKEAGLRVPEDIAIAGFGDEPSSSSGFLTLTSVMQPLMELNKAAFDDFQQALAGLEIPRDHYIEFACHLVVRESSQRPATPFGA